MRCCFASWDLVQPRGQFQPVDFPVVAQMLKLAGQASSSLLTHILLSRVKIIGKQCLEKNFGDLWSKFLFYASFSQWLAETEFWKSPRVFMWKNFTPHSTWYIWQVSRFLLMWSSSAGFWSSFSQWGDGHWLKLSFEHLIGYLNQTLAYLVCGDHVTLI